MTSKNGLQSEKGTIVAFRTSKSFPGATPTGTRAKRCSDEDCAAARGDFFADTISTSLVLLLFFLRSCMLYRKPMP
jgi:hypothetical protein